MDRTSLAWASFILLLAVAFGAFGAHGLKARIDVNALSQWNTAVQYQFYHGLAIFGLALLADRITPKRSRLARSVFLLGIALFCGSLYLLSTRSITGLHGITPILGPITPLGGLFFIGGWLLLFITALRTDRSH